MSKIKYTNKKLSLFSTTFLISALWPFATTAYAETANIDDSNIDEIIVIQATRRNIPVESLPNTIRLIEKEAIEEQFVFSTSLVDIISQTVASFSPSRQKLSGAGESFRGRSPLYLIDGVPQSNPLRNGSRDGFTLDAAVVERIEILFGANAIQGVGATGGVINYVTLAPTDEDDWQFRTEAQINVTDSIDGDGTGYRGSATILRDFGAIDLVASVALESRNAYYDAKGRRIGIDNVQGDIQDSFSVNYFLKAGWDIDEDTRFQLSANIFELKGDGDYIQVAGDRDAGIPTSSIRADQEGFAPVNTANTFSAIFTKNNLFGGDLTIQGFYRKFEAIYGGGRFGGFFNTGAEAAGEETFDQSANNSNKTGAKLTYSHGNLPIDGLTVTGGVDWLHDKTFQALVQTGRLWVPEVEFDSIAPFLQFDQQFLDDRALISFGLRHESATLKIDDYQTIFFYGATEVGGGEPNFSETLFNIGGSFEILDGVKLYSSYAQGFTMPDVGRVLRAVTTPGLDIASLLNIEPIIADNIEIGFSFEKGGFTSNAAYFWSESEFGQRLASNSQNIFEVVREPTEINGFEISAEYTFEAPVTIGATYANIEGKSDQDADGVIDEDIGAISISPDRLNLYITAQPTDAISIRAQLTTLFDRTFNDTTTDTDFDGYSLLDLSIGYQFEDIGRFNLGVQNALNKDYITYFSQSVDYAASRGDRFFSGRGRTIILRWSAEF